MYACIGMRGLGLFAVFGADPEGMVVADGGRVSVHPGIGWKGPTEVLGRFLITLKDHDALL